MYKPGAIKFKRCRFTIGVIAGMVILIIACLNLGVASPRPDHITGGAREIPISLWIAAQGNIFLMQDVPIPASPKAVVKIGKNASAIMWHYSPGAASNNRGDFLHYVGNTNIILRLEGYPTSLYLDIPPPAAPLSL